MGWKHSLLGAQLLPELSAQEGTEGTMAMQDSGSWEAG